VIILEIETSRKEADPHEESTKKCQELLPFGTEMPVHDITEVTPERSCHKIEEAARQIKQKLSHQQRIE